MNGPHLTLDDLMDVADGTRPVPPHVETCDACRLELAGLRRTMAVVAEVEVPEPSPLYWDHLSSRIKEAVGIEPPPRWSVADALGWRAWLRAGALALVVLAVVLGVVRSRAPEMTGAPAARSAAIEREGTVEPDAVTDAAASSDPSLELIADLSEGLDWDAATAAGWTTATTSLDQTLEHLTDDERATLHQLLQEALSGKGA